MAAVNKNTSCNVCGCIFTKQNKRLYCRKCKQSVCGLCSQNKRVCVRCNSSNKEKYESMLHDSLIPDESRQSQANLEDSLLIGPGDEPKCILCNVKHPYANLYRCTLCQINERKTVCEQHLPGSHSRISDHTCNITDDHIICLNKKVRKLLNKEQNNNLFWEVSQGTASAVGMSAGYCVAFTFPALLNGGIRAFGSVFGTVGIAAFETICLFRQLSKGTIKTQNEMCRKLARCWYGAGVSLGAFKLGAMGGAFIGTAICPGIGTFIGGIVGGLAASIIFGFATRCGIDWLWGKYVNEPNPKLKLRKEAWKCFFENTKYKFDDQDAFNERILTRAYHRLCLRYHPDVAARAGDKDSDIILGTWLTLSAHYGALKETLEERSANGVSENHESSNKNRLSIAI